MLVKNLKVLLRSSIPDSILNVCIETKMKIFKRFSSNPSSQGKKMSFWEKWALKFKVWFFYENFLIIFLMYLAKEIIFVFKDVQLTAVVIWLVLLADMEPHIHCNFCMIIFELYTISYQKIKNNFFFEFLKVFLS